MLYIPGFWDSIKGSATGFTNDLLRTVKHEVFGRHDMQQMLKQNSMLAGQLANMEEGQRDAFAQAFGLKNAAASPIGNIGTTAQLRGAQRTERLQGDAEAADPAGVLTQFGARTPEDLAIRQEQVKQAPLQTKGLEQNLEQGALSIEQGKQTIELNKYRIKDAARISTQIEQAFQNYPTLQGLNIPEIAQAVVSGRQVDPDLMARITNDPGAAPLFEQYVRTLRDQVTEGFIRGRIKLSEDRNESSQMRMLINQGAADANQQVGRALQEMKMWQSQLSNKMMLDLKTGKPRADAPPDVVAEYNRLKEELDIAYANNDTYGEARAKLAGVEFQKRDRGTENVNDPAFQQELSAAQAAMSRATTDAQRQKIRERFRQNTGQELP
jgi:hypothetical protein